MKTLLLPLTILFLLATIAFSEQCGWQAGNALCPNGLCCSQYGYCGSTSAYCDPNTCQSQCSSGSTGAQCGRQAGNAVCPNGLCCSQYGYCGSTAEYCDPNTCQSQCSSGSSGAQCGRQAGNALCPNGLCCSQYGYCGTTTEYCDPSTCQSQCTGSGSSGGTGVGSIITRDIFNQMLLHRGDVNCEGNALYTYDGFINAAGSYGAFGTTGDTNTRKRELAAFFAQTSHETTGGWATAPDGPYAWGYCKVREGNPNQNFCDSSSWPCPLGSQAYYGRGPIQLSHNYNYGQFGNSIGRDLLNNPDLIATDPTITFRSAIWFWMTAQGNKPSSHDVITGQWTPSAADLAAGRVPGFGVITNIINGGLECGQGPNAQSNDRIGYYQRYCQILGVSPGNNLDCNNQAHF